MQKKIENIIKKKARQLSPYNKQIADDLYGEAIVSYYTARHEVPDKEESYYVKAAYNGMLNYMRKLTSQKRTAKEVSLDDFDNTDFIEALTIQPKSFLLLQKIILSLDLLDKAIIQLYYFCGWKDKEIAQLFSTQRSVISMRRHKILDYIKNLIKKREATLESFHKELVCK